MTKPDPVRYRTMNWKFYNAALRRRGSLLIWLDKDMTWLAIRAGRPGSKDHSPPQGCLVSIDAPDYCDDLAREAAPLRKIACLIKLFSTY